MAVIVYAPQGSGMSERALEQLREHFKLGRTFEAHCWNQLFDPKKLHFVKAVNALIFVRDELPQEYQHMVAAMPRRLLAFRDAAAQAGPQVAVEAEG